MNGNNKINTGTTISISRKVKAGDIETFGELSLDRNAMHFDEKFAAGSIFQKRIAHGMIGSALISGALTELMGDGNILLSFSIKFEKPIYINDELTCILMVKEIDKKGIATIDVRIMNKKEERVIFGSVQSMRFIT